MTKNLTVFDMPIRRKKRKEQSLLALPKAITRGTLPIREHHRKNESKSYYTRELEYRMLSIPLNRLELVNQNSNSKISLQQKSTGLFLNVKCSATYVNIYIN